MALVIAYMFFILVGPVIFIGLIQPTPTTGRFAIGAASAVMLVGAAFAMRQMAGTVPVAAIGWLAAMWLGWIVTIAMVVQAIALRRGFGRKRKWSAALGAAATMLPWFGLSLSISATG